MMYFLFFIGEQKNIAGPGSMKIESEYRDTGAAFIESSE